MNLRSKRLLKIAECIENYKKGSILADIGTDHAYLPCFLYEHSAIKLAYACEVAEGPFQSCSATIHEEHLEDKVIALLGDGLDPIVNKHIDMISICGMGGLLITQILDRHQELFEGHRFFLQANTALDLLRGYLDHHGMKIICEAMVKDGHHIYEIIVCEQGDHEPLSESDCFFGPVLKKEKGPLFKEKWHHALKINENILAGLSPDHEKYSEISHLKAMIEEVLS